MSGLVDMWTEEQAKIRNKGSADIPSGSGPIPAPESSQPVQPKERSSLFQWPPTVTSVFPKISSPFAYSEASLTMLVQCFSP
ncbi:hypothetical protein RHSIM_Rhsim11G0170900 [Rhododendron simsii]|uniref:Uncharacterized protein n=1 Tax=Rhododendron simsii TaxID=118357 RepID=A0A834G8J7_RHOSS|nr:hypothetical protein RHSIM_Rhsim11G0170900 [Rhododendron simsii]